MAGFWTGLAQGYSTAKDRIEKRKLFQQEVLEKRRDALIPIVAKRQQAEQEYRKAQNQVKSFFAARLKDTDVPPEQMQAFLNIASSDPERGLQLMEYIQKFETKNETRLAGEDLIKATRIFEDTKPEDMEVDEWIEVAANVSATDDEGGFNATATIDRIIGATSEELRELSIELAGPVGGSSVGGDTPLGVDQGYVTSDMAERAKSGSDSGPKRTDETDAADRFNTRINTRAIELQEEELARANSILKDEKLRLEADSESEEEAAMEGSATSQIAKAGQLVEDILDAKERQAKLTEGSGIAASYAAIPSSIRRQAFDEVYQSDEDFRTFYDSDTNNPALTGNRGYLFDVWTGGEAPTYTAPEIPKAPVYEAPEVPEAPIYAPVQEEGEEDTGNPFMDKFQ